MSVARRILFSLILPISFLFATPGVAVDPSFPPIAARADAVIPAEALFRWSPSVDVGHGSPIGKRFDGPYLTLDDGSERALSTLLDGQRSLIAVRDPGCPVSRRYAPRLAKLHDEELPVLYLLVGKMATRAFVEQDRERHGLKGRYILDPEQRLASWLGVRSTGDVFLFDTEARLRYRGAIDDQYGIGFTRPAPTHTFLKDAIAALRAGESPEVVATVAPGCVLQMPEPNLSKASLPVNWHGKISRIVQNKCQKCHRPGQAAPFPLLSYDDVTLRTPMIRFVLANHIMPPWFASNDPSLWQGEYHLDPRDRQLMIDWVDAGAPLGDARQAPSPVDWKEGWQASEPDVILTSGRLLSIPAEGDIRYRYVEIETDFDQDRWVEAIEVRSQRPQNTHHIVVSALPPAQKDEIFGVLDQDQDYTLTELDKTEMATRGFFGIYGPGTTFIRYPKGLAKRLPKGWRLLMQVHHEPNGEVAEDRPQIGLHFAERPPSSVVSTLAAANLFIIIPPNKKGHEEQATHRLKQDGRLLAFLPHMHLRGQAFRYELERKDGTRETLLDVPRYDPNWQYLYQLKQPVPVKSGERILATAWYDNSPSNPNNPDPSKLVIFGQQTDEEMMIGYFDIVTKPGDEPNH